MSYVNSEKRILADSERQYLLATGERLMRKNRDASPPNRNPIIDSLRSHASKNAADIFGHRLSSGRVSNGRHSVCICYLLSSFCLPKYDTQKTTLRACRPLTTHSLEYMSLSPRRRATFGNKQGRKMTGGGGWRYAPGNSKHARMT